MIAKNTILFDTQKNLALELLPIHIIMLHSYHLARIFLCITMFATCKFAVHFDDIMLGWDSLLQLLKISLFLFGKYQLGYIFICEER